MLWLQQALQNESRELFIAESCGVSVGTVRADYRDGQCELSWTVAPGQRGKGAGREMVSILASRVAVPIQAEIMKDNRASIRIAEHVGMVLIGEDAGVLHYRGGAQDVKDGSPAATREH